MQQVETASVYKRGSSGPHKLIKDPHADVRVFKTLEYSQFDFTPENRPISIAHLERLKQSIYENGFIESCPILVVKRNDRLVILDGQHRFRACQELKLAVPYMISPDDGGASTTLRVINAYSRTWKDPDYMHHFLKLGSRDYIELKDFMENHELSISVSLGLLRGLFTSIGADAKHLFRTGSLMFSQETVAKANKQMEPVNEIRNLHPKLGVLRKHPAFIRALFILTRSRHYEHDRFIRNLSANLGICVWCTSVANYLTLLEGIYNYKRKEGTRIRLSRKGITLLKAEEDGDE